MRTGARGTLAATGLCLAFETAGAAVLYTLPVSDDWRAIVGLLAALAAAPLFLQRRPALEQRIIEEVNRAGTAFLLIEQNAGMALEIAHRGYVLVKGQIGANGHAAELLASEIVRKLYF